jgi:hypothetical protein
VYKDQYTFGIRKVEDDQLVGQPEQFGLVSYKPIGNHQFWLNFSDNDSKLLMETVQATRNAQKLIEVKPRTPTAEELAEKEAEQARLAAAAKKGGKGAATEVVEEAPPEPSFEEGPPNFLDSLFADSDVAEATTGPCITSTMRNGLIVRHMPNGDIVQILDASLMDRKDHTEIDRVFLSGGIVIRHFANLDAEILYPNGEHAKFDRAQMKWTITNDRGFRREYQDGVYKDLPKINCLNQTDPKTGIVTKVREDNVVLIRYEEGNLYCQHHDGT